MTKTIIDATPLHHDAHSLRTFINGLMLQNHIDEFDLRVVWVKLPDGTPINAVHLEEETLTDGSKVYNLILTPEKQP